jgi:transposase
MSLEGMGPSLAVEGPTTREVFETYLEKVLAPALREGQIVVMDNLSSHKGSRVRELIEECGCELLYLPPYSPDLNPIEEAFAKLKALLRKRCCARLGHAPEKLSAGSDGSGARCGDGERCQGLLRASWLPPTGSTAMTNALEGV